MFNHHALSIGAHDDDAANLHESPLLNRRHRGGGGGGVDDVNALDNDGDEGIPVAAVL